MDRARTVQRITAAFLGAEAVYLAGLAVVLSQFSGSMRQFDGASGTGSATVASALILLAGVVLGVVAVHALRSSAGPDEVPGSTRVFPIAAGVNVGVLTVGVVSAFWPLVAVAVAATTLVGVQIAWERQASAVATGEDEPGR